MPEDSLTYILDYPEKTQTVKAFTKVKAFKVMKYKKISNSAAF